MDTSRDSSNASLEALVNLIDDEAEEELPSGQLATKDVENEDDDVETEEDRAFIDDDNKIIETGTAPFDPTEIIEDALDSEEVVSSLYCFKSQSIRVLTII